MAIIDKIQLSGTVYTIGNETTTAVTSASTDNEIPTAKAVYDAIPQGGGGSSINVVQTTGTSTTDVMSQDAITNALRKTNLVSTSYSSGHLDLECKDPFNTSYRTMLKFGTINGMTVANIGSERPSFSLVETSAFTAHTADTVIHVTSDEKAAWNGKQDTLVSGTNIKTINNQSILGEGNITIQGGSGGGKAIEAGTNISITTGETADTINCTLNVKNGTNGGIIVGDSECTATGLYGISLGHSSDASGNYSLCMGSNSSCKGQQSIVIGDGSSDNGSDFTYCFGRNLHPNRVHQFLEGANLYSNNEYEVAFGQYNVSSRSNYNFGDSGNTLFSIGNGYDFSSTHNRHNALEIRQNGDIYIANTNDTSITGDKAYSLYPMIKLQDALGGGSSYTAGDGIDINNDVISVTGKVDTTTYETYTASTDTALASKQTTLTAGTGISIVDNVISATGGSGGGGESCTVDSSTMFYTFNYRYSNDALDMRVRYAVLDYGQDRTEIPNVSIDVNFRDANYNTYVNQNINLDYSTSSYTLGDISQAEYIDVTYDSTIEDFKIAVATAYTSTVFVGAINFWTGNIKVPFYTISSGSPCTAIENDIPTAISELGNNMLKGLRQINISSQKNAIYTYYETIGGNGEQRKLKLDEIDGSSSTLKPDIYIGLGTSGWTEINLSEQCNIGSLKATKYRVTYNDSELDSYSMGLQLTVEYAGNEINDSVFFDETKQPSLQTQDVFSAATLDWNASTKELVITYPETIELYGKQESVNIGQIYSNGCNFGKAITKLESYGEAKQALKSYVKETRAALGGKLDTSAITTSVTSSSTDTQVPSAKAVYDMVGNINTILESI